MRGSRHASRLASVGWIRIAAGYPERCYRCGNLTRGIVGVLAPTTSGDRLAFREFDDVASILASVLSEEALRPLHIGPVKVRRSRQRGAYVSNGCVHCDAILGSFPLREALLEYLAEGGSLRALVVGASKA